MTLFYEYLKIFHLVLFHIQVTLLSSFVYNSKNKQKKTAYMIEKLKFLYKLNFWLGLGPYTSWIGPVKTKKRPPSGKPLNIDIKVDEQTVHVSWKKVYKKVVEENIRGYYVSHLLKLVNSKINLKVNVYTYTKCLKPIFMFFT